MPADDGLGLDQDERLHPPRPETPQCQPRQAIDAVEVRPRMSALEHGDLLSERENLQSKIVACAKEREEVGEEREHAVSGALDRADVYQRLREKRMLLGHPRLEAAAGQTDGDLRRRRGVGRVLQYAALVVLDDGVAAVEHAQRAELVHLGG